MHQFPGSLFFWEITSNCHFFKISKFNKNKNRHKETQKKIHMKAISCSPFFSAHSLINTSLLLPVHIRPHIRVILFFFFLNMIFITAKQLKKHSFLSFSSNHCYRDSQLWSLDGEFCATSRLIISNTLKNFYNFSPFFFYAPQN